MPVSRHSDLVTLVRKLENFKLLRHLRRPLPSMAIGRKYKHSGGRAGDICVPCCSCLHTEH